MHLLLLHDTWPQSAGFNNTHVLALSSVGERSGWARLDSAQGIEGQTQGVGHTELLSGDSGRKSTPQLA